MASQKKCTEALNRSSWRWWKSCPSSKVNLLVPESLCSHKTTADDSSLSVAQEKMER